MKCDVTFLQHVCMVASSPGLSTIQFWIDLQSQKWTSDVKYPLGRHRGDLGVGVLGRSFGEVSWLECLQSGKKFLQVVRDKEHTGVTPYFNVKQWQPLLLSVEFVTRIINSHSPPLPLLYWIVRKGWDWWRMFSGEFSWNTITTYHRHLDSLANSHMPRTCTVGWGNLHKIFAIFTAGLILWKCYSWSNHCCTARVHVHQPCGQCPRKFILQMISQTHCNGAFTNIINHENFLSYGICKSA